MISCIDEKGDKWEVYQNEDGWRWKHKAAGNHEVVGSSTEAYHNKADCIANARRNGMTCTPT